MRASLLNILTVVFLGLIAVGMIGMPRFNYRLLMERQAGLEADLRKLGHRLERAELLIGTEGEDGTRRVAILRGLDSIPELLSSLQDELSTLSDRSPTLVGQIDNLALRVARLEGEAPGEIPPRSGDLSALVNTRKTEPIALTGELRAKAERLSARGLAEASFDDFLFQAAGSELLPAGADALPAELKEALDRVFSIYKLTIGLINQTEQVYVQELVETASDDGLYAEVPLTADEGTLRRLSLSGKGIIHMRRLEYLGVQRIYRFPLVEYPELKEYEIQRENVRDHLVHDITQFLRTEGG